ncbi:MAG: hypothetical protein ABJG68_07510 [Crocinitomicaceae bacterium]
MIASQHKYNPNEEVTQIAVAHVVSPKPSDKTHSSITQLNDNRSSSVIQRAVIQRAYDDPGNAVQRAVHALAQRTAAGRAGLATGRGELTVQIANEWKTLTRDGTLGIGIPREAFEAMEAWGGAADRELENGDQYAVQIAHELTHLRHYIDAPGTYAVRGHRGNWEGGGHEWDADPEESLTVRGFARIPVATWQAMYQEAYQASHMDELIRRRDGFNDELRTATGGARRAFQRNLREVQGLIDAIRLDEEPAGAEMERDFYVFRDPHHENAARTQLGFNQRERYADDRFERVPRMAAEGPAAAVAVEEQAPVVALRRAFDFGDLRERIERLGRDLHAHGQRIREQRERLDRIGEGLQNIRIELDRIRQNLEGIRRRLDRL